MSKAFEDALRPLPVCLRHQLVAHVHGVQREIILAITAIEASDLDEEMREAAVQALRAGLKNDVIQPLIVGHG